MINPYDVVSGDEGSDERAVQFMELFTPRQSRIFAYVFALVPNATDAYDVYQQTVMSMWQKFAERDQQRDFTGWALKTAHFEVLTYRRANARGKIRFSDELLAEIADSHWIDERDFIAGEDVLQRLRDCMTKLNPNDLDLVQRCYRDQSSIKSVAKTLGRTSQSICNSLRRIRSLLLNCVDRSNDQAENLA